MSSTITQTAAEQINPTFSMQVDFRAKLEDRVLFSLNENPEIGTWLMGFVDMRLVKQGKLATNDGIAPPPGGAIQDELVRGGIIFLTERPDGGHGLRLNPKLAIWLLVTVRLLNQPSRQTPIGIYDEPEVAKWLLSYQLSTDQSADDLAPSDEVLAKLREIGVIVDRIPIADVFLTDSQFATEAGQELSLTGRTYPQAAGECIPVPVREILGKHSPDLPPDTDLLWLKDAGTGLMFPTLAAPHVTRDSPNNVAEEQNARREAEWKKQRTEAAESIKSHGYAVLREIFPPAQQEILRHYFRELFARGYFPPLGDDPDVELRTGIHNQQTIASFHHGLAILLSDICQKQLIASYCYLASYEPGAILKRHTDREQCIYDLSMVFDMQGPDGEPDPWPIYLELDNKPVAAHLQVGDGVFFPGSGVPHWREALPEGRRVIQCFFHFVDKEFRGSLN
jgi:hypothetical protein